MAWTICITLNYCTNKLLSLSLVDDKKNCKNIYVFYFQIFNNEALPQTSLTFLSWNKKVRKKINLVEVATLNINQINLILFCLNAAFNTVPTSLEKLTLEKLKSPKLIPTKYVGTLTRTIFKRFSHLFFGSPDKVNPSAWLICRVLQIYKTNISIFAMY